MSDSALLRWSKVISGTSTVVHAHRMFCKPRCGNRAQSLRHRPNETRLATCALQGDSKPRRRSCTKQPGKFLRIVLCRPGTLVPSFRTSTRGSRAVAQCDTTPTTCAAPVTQPPAILPTRCVLRDTPKCQTTGNQQRAAARVSTSPSLATRQRLTREVSQVEPNKVRDRGPRFKDRLHAAPDPVGFLPSDVVGGFARTKEGFE